MEYHHNHIANNMRNQEDQMTILPSPSTATTRSTSSAASSSSNWPPSASSAPLAAASTPPPDRELMFEKVVTPSDVGKLNRLVIPKQHAERYFPLDPSSADRGTGLLLNFEEDHTGRPWRFRYSYWNSSQSYVMTKGWSRFVKDKHLRAGDTVSFSRADAGRRLFIDWRRRPFLDPHPALLPAWAAAAAWNTNAAYHLPAPPLHPPPPLYFRTSMSMSPMLPSSQQLHGVDHRILDSVPVVAGGPMFEPRRHVRLFGVNLDECSAAEQQEDRSVSPLQWRLSAAATPRARTHGELQLMPPPSMEESRR